MRLPDFIANHKAAILEHWESFAATRLPPAGAMNQLALRDHCPEILDAVVKDLRTSQSYDEQERKSKGLAPVRVDAPETAAQSHAVLRAKHGFDINQLASEYRALRASVLKLWTGASEFEHQEIDDLVRFNEAIDQALAESISFFHRHVERERNLFLGILGHDLRSPLQTIHVTAAYLAALDAGEEVSRAASRLISSGSRMQALLDDIVQFNRFNLGVRLRVSPSPCDLAEAFAKEVDLLRVAHEDRRIELRVRGDCSGSWDGLRLRQALTNLVENAIQYGSPVDPVGIALAGDPERIRIHVTNSGATIPPDQLESVFKPLRRGTSADTSEHRDYHLGLGLFVVKEIVTAHGGEVSVRSKEGETVFTISLPRERAADRTTQPVGAPGERERSGPYGSS